jgi:NADH-quinone oxidoreductase subunit D
MSIWPEERVIANTLENDGLNTVDMTINVGPQHPATHGVFRMLLTVDGEVVVDCQPYIGYLHRGLE